MELTLCIPCQYGAHEDCQKVMEVPLPGVMGGSQCYCKGECVENKDRNDLPAELTD